MQPDEIYEEVLRQLRATTRAPIEVLQQTSDSLRLRVGPRQEAVLEITVYDPARPSFSVSHPALAFDAGSFRDVRVVHANEVVFQGLLWITNQVATYGATIPEFPSPSLQRALRRGRDRKQSAPTRRRS